MLIYINRFARDQVGVGGGGLVAERGPRAAGGPSANPRSEGLQHAQDCDGRHVYLHGPHQGPLPEFGCAAQAGHGVREADKDSGR